MIVNLKYFKKQWSDFPAFGISSFRVTNPDLRKTLYTLTALQLWFQLFSIILLVISSVLEWYVKKYGKNSDHQWIGYNQLYFNTSLLFQICDVILSIYASYHFLWNATTRYNNIQDARIWIIVNNIYILSTVTCFLFAWFKVGSIVICIKTIIILTFANYKIYIVHKIYKDDRSSYIFLEQSPSPIPNLKKSVDGYELSQNYDTVEFEVESSEKFNFEPLFCTENQ